MDRSANLSPEMLDAAVELMGRAGRGGSVRVQGDSMVPTLRAGQRLAVEFAPERLSRGDLLLFRQAGYLVVHRLLDRTRTPDGAPALRTRGDGALGLDPHVLMTSVVGRVIAAEDDGGWWNFASTGARFYGRAAARHDRFWAAMGFLGGLLDRIPAKIGLRTPFRRWAAWFDRTSLRLAHRLLFARFHGRRPLPKEAGEGTLV